MFRWKIAQFAEIRWWKNYLSKKDVTDYQNWKRNYWNEFLKSCDLNNKISDESLILDAGCGPAGIFMVLNGKVDAIDPLLDEYEKLDHFKKEIYPDISFIKASIEEYNSDKLYDYLFCINAINHVEDLNASLHKIASLIKDKGVLIISIDAHNYQLLKYLFRLIPGDILHPHQHDLKDYITMIESEGFKLLKKTKLKHEFIFDYHVLIFKKD